MTGQGEEDPSFVISVAQLTERERNTLRCTTLLRKDRLTAHWRISDLDEESHCRFVAPAPGSQDGHIECRDAASNAISMVEADWPLNEASIVRALNTASERLRTTAVTVNPRASWISRLQRLSPIKSRESSPTRTGTGAIEGFLKRFGLVSSKPSMNILFAGPPGSGKTTAISITSTIPARTTEASATDDVGTLKARTTISIDYGECEFGGYRLRLFGTPGQLRFAYMVEQTLANCDAVILLADLSSPTPLDDVQRFARLVSRHIRDGKPVVVGLTHVDRAPLPRHFHRHLAEALGRRVPAVPLDPRNPASTRRVLRILTGALNADISHEPVVA